MSAHAKKSLGQHFLMHASIAERIADAAGLMKTDTVLEIGPGRGILTGVLLARARTVYAVEADRELFDGLVRLFADEIAAGRLRLFHADIRAFDLGELPRSYALVANIPYYLTGEILRTFLSAKHQPRSMTLLVQKEVAIRIARERKGSLLALSVKAYGAPHYRFTVPSGAFLPAPKVDSAVLTISDISRARFRTTALEKRFFELLRAGFAHKRKRLLGNLEAVASREKLEKAFKTMVISENARAEDLDISIWLGLAKILKDG